MGDIGIIIGITFMLLLLGAVMPFIDNEYGGDHSRSGADLETPESDTYTVLSAWEVFKSMLLMGFWTFGQLPWYIDTFIMLPIRFTLYLTIARNIWPGGGA